MPNNRDSARMANSLQPTKGPQTDSNIGQPGAFRGSVLRHERQPRHSCKGTRARIQNARGDEGDRLITGEGVNVQQRDSQRGGQQQRQQGPQPGVVSLARVCCR